jgi:outer membrane protein assembly factor BamB
VANLPPLTSGQSDWLHWRGNGFDGKSTTTGIIKDWSNGLTKLWQADFLCQNNASGSWSSPVVMGNRLIIPGRNQDEDLVFCLDAENGTLLWKGSYKASAESAHGAGSRATPFIDSSRVYTFGRSGDLACWQLSDGKLLWKQNVKDQGGKEPQWGFSTTPLVLDNMVYVQGGGSALALAYNKMDGSLLWKSMEGDAGYSAIVPLLIDSVSHVLVYHANGLACLNAHDGKPSWNAGWITDYGVNASTPIIEGNTIFNSSGYGSGCRLIEFTKTNYKELWKNKNIEAQHTDPILIDGYLYGYTGESSQNKGDFTCVELKTGKQMWKTNQIGQGTTTYADGHLICFDIKGNLYLVKPSPKAFEKLGEIKAAMPDVKNPSWTVPVVANGKLYLRYLQRLVCYKLV